MTEAIKKLEDLPKVGPATASKLRAAGYHTIESVGAASSKELSTATGISRERALELSKKAREVLQISFLTAEELLNQRKNVTRLTIQQKKIGIIR